MRTKAILTGAAVALALAAAGAALAADMAGVIQARQTHYKAIGAASKGIYDELNKPAPQATVIQGYAHQLNTLAPQIPTWFPVGSGPEAGVKTQAKAEIWSQPAAFKTAADGFAAAAHHFDATAAAGDIGAIRAEYPTLTKACGNCHTQFRSKAPG
ncbi:MAG TPA: cytochrome c [Caulobacteraceae bacterium]|jgi:cytochrome c556